MKDRYQVTVQYTANAWWVVVAGDDPSQKWPCQKCGGSERHTMQCDRPPPVRVIRTELEWRTLPWAPRTDAALAALKMVRGMAADGHRVAEDEPVRFTVMLCECENGGAT